MQAFLFLTALAAASAVDCRKRTIPDFLCLLTAAAGLISFSPAQFFGVLAALPLLIAALIRPECMGGGDIKLTAAAGFVLGFWRGIWGMALGLLLAVLGGAFAEGVDLAGERLQNVIVVSTGLPQMDARVRAMRRYHDENGADGAFLCMTLPGMVRVIQSAGRLIRTQSDHGALLLIDSRYQREAERALLSGTLIGDALSG